MSADVCAAWPAERKEREPADVMPLRWQGVLPIRVWLYSKQPADVMPLRWQGVLVISAVFRNAEGPRIHSLADRGGQSEGETIQTFFNTVEKHSPQVVCWNRAGFDLPVLHYRGPRHGVVANKYWDKGEDDREIKWNNHIGRHRMRRPDLMDLLALHQPKNNAPLDAMARLCGFPGKPGMDGLTVYPAYVEGKPEDIRRCCETDVMHMYLLSCGVQKMRGGLPEQEYERDTSHVEDMPGQLATHEAHGQEHRRGRV